MARATQNKLNFIQRKICALTILFIYLSYHFQRIYSMKLNFYCYDFFPLFYIFIDSSTHDFFISFLMNFFVMWVRKRMWIIYVAVFHMYLQYNNDESPYENTYLHISENDWWNKIQKGKNKIKPKKRLNNEVLFISMLVNFSTINMCTYGSRIIMNEIKFNVRLNMKLDWIG